MSAHDKEVNPVKDLFLLSTEKQLAALGAVDDHNDVVLLAKAGNGLQREDSSTLAGNLEHLKVTWTTRSCPTWSQSKTENSWRA